MACEVGTAARGPPSSLQKCRRCGEYFTFDTETKAQSSSCRFHPGRFGPYGGRTAGTLSFGSLPPFWRCCGASSFNASGCKVLPNHVQDDRFLDATMQFSLVDRECAPADWPPGAQAAAGDCDDSGGRDDCKQHEKPSDEPAKDWVEVRVLRDDTVAKLSVRYGCSPVLLRAINNLAGDMMLMSRNTVLVPPHNPDVIPPPPPETEDEIRERKVRQLMKQGGMSREEARFHLDMADGMVEKALWEYRSDLAWEKDHCPIQPPAIQKGKSKAMCIT